MALSISVTSALENAQKNFLSNPTEATATVLAKALAAKALARVADVAAGGHKPRHSNGLGIMANCPAASEQGQAAQAAWNAAAAKGLFPDGARLVFQAREGDLVFETSGYNLLMRKLYQAPNAPAVTAVCTPEWFGALAQAIAVCKRAGAGASFGYMGIALNQGSAKALAFIRAYQAQQAVQLPPFQWKGERDAGTPAVSAAERATAKVAQHRPRNKFGADGPFAALAQWKTGN